MHNLFKAILCIFCIIIGVLTFDFYFKSSTDEKTNKKSYTPQNRIEKKEDVTTDSLHISLPVLFMLSYGGTIDATCNNGYKINIISISNENTNYFIKLLYTFPTKEAYLNAISYIKKKGYRWILNHQFEVESEDIWESSNKGNFKHSFEYEGSNMITVDTMWLSSIKESEITP